jgi:hypothetical protein
MSVVDYMQAGSELAAEYVSDVGGNAPKGRSGVLAG